MTNLVSSVICLDTQFKECTFISIPFVRFCVSPLITFHQKRGDHFLFDATRKNRWRKHLLAEDCLTTYGSICCFCVCACVCTCVCILFISVLFCSFNVSPLCVCFSCFDSHSTLFSPFNVSQWGVWSCFCYLVLFSFEMQADLTFALTLFQTVGGLGLVEIIL